MIEHTDFTSVLRSFMARAHRTITDLARLTGLSINTLKNWSGGVVKRPRVVNDVLIVARALGLDALDTTTLLTAAGHPPLKTLQAQQNNDKALRMLLAAWPAASAPAPGVAAAPLAPPPRTARHQLRAPLADFVGRAREIDQLVHALQAAVAQERGAIISGVQGMGGIGKTELAYVIAHRLRDIFPDAQIVLNLRGSSAAPLTAEQTLQAVIHTLTPDAQLPDDLAVLEQHYRSLLHNSRMLVMVDDARDALQVQVLLPPAGSAVLITSRQRFTLPGMISVDLEQLGADEAAALLRAICPRLDEAEADLIAQTCGYLPLALRISGSILHTIPALSIAAYIARLVDERQRLIALRDPDDPQLNVEASLMLSYSQLDHATQHIFRQLGVFVADFAMSMARAVVVTPVGSDIEATFHLLLRRNLIMVDRAGNRWRLHDLVRDLARTMLETAGEADPVWWRYVHAAVQVAQKIQEEYEAGGERVPAVLTRFDTERAHIDAGRRWAANHAGTPEGDRLLVDGAAATVYIGRIRYDARHEIIPQFDHACAAARRLGDQRAEACALNNLGAAYTELGEIRHAIPYFEQALTIFGALGERHIEGCVLGNVGDAYAALGEFQDALSYFEQALAIFRALGSRGSEGWVLGNLGTVYTGLRQPQRAIECCEASLMIIRDIGDRRLEAHALSYLAHAQAWQRDIVHAIATYEQALSIFQEVGDHVGEARCNWQFGFALASQGQHERALPFLRAAVAYEQEIGHAKAAEHATLLAQLEAREEQERGS